MASVLCSGDIRHIFCLADPFRCLHAGRVHPSGSIFVKVDIRWTKSGSWYSFSGVGTQMGGKDGEIPYAAPIEGTDGNFYGTTYQGGTNTVGTIYQLTPSGKLTTIYQFDAIRGAFPIGPLVQATDGNLYGTTAGFGFNYGTMIIVSISVNREYSAVALNPAFFAT